jgi:hypothetical protein
MNDNDNDNDNDVVLLIRTCKYLVTDVSIFGNNFSQKKIVLRSWIVGIVGHDGRHLAKCDVASVTTTNKSGIMCASFYVTGYAPIIHLIVGRTLHGTCTMQFLFLFRGSHWSF